MPTINAQINSNGHDCFEADDGAFFFAELDGHIWLGSFENADVTMGLQWPLAIPQGATITAAHLSLYINDKIVPSTQPIAAYGSDTDDIADWSAGNRPATITKTSASAAFNLTDAPSSGWWNNLVDLKDILQEVVSRGGWTSGNTFGLLLEPSTIYSTDKEIQVVDYSSTPSLAAKLDVTYTTSSPQTVEIIPATLDLVGQQFNVTAVLPPQTVEIIPATLELVGQQFTIATDNNQTIEIIAAAINLIGQQFTIDAPVTVEILPAAIELIGQQFQITTVIPSQSVEIIPAAIEIIGQQMLVTAVSAPKLIGHAVPLPLSATSQDATDHEDGTHSHSALASSAPGAAEWLLKTNTDGGLTLEEFGATRITSDLIPELTDTYDLGTQNLLWRKGWLSELDTILFAQNTITLLGGWFMVSKDAGTLAEEVNNSQTQIDFGKTMTTGDFVILRQSLQVEYLEIGTLASGTTYNVTRNVDGSSANTWPEGAPFVVLGQEGDGRIELSAYDTPRISILDQGATYNAQTEITRLGDLDGNWGYTAEEFGIALGEFATDKANLTWDPTNGLRLRTHDQTVLQLDNAGNASIKGVLDIGNDGGIYQGGGTFASPTTGLKIWNESGVGSIAGFNAGDKQWWGETDGNFYFANGQIRLNENGMEFLGTGDDNGKLYLDGFTIDSLFGTILDITNISDPLDSLPAAIRLKAEAGPQGLDAGEAEIRIDAGHSNSSINPSHTATSKIDLSVDGSTGLQVIKNFTNGRRINAYDNLFFHFGGTQIGDIGGTDTTWLRINNTTAKNIYTPRLFRADGGLAAGNITPGSNNIGYSGDLRAYRNSTLYSGYIYVPLFNGATNSSWDGDDHKATGNHTITVSNWSGVPANCKAVVCEIRGQPTASNCVLYLGGGTNPFYTWQFISEEVNQSRQVQVVAPLNGSGQFIITVQNANFNWAILRISGYFI